MAYRCEILGKQDANQPNTLSDFFGGFDLPAKLNQALSSLSEKFPFDLSENNSRINLVDMDPLAKDMDVDNLQNGNATEEPPTKKARLEDSSVANGQDRPPRENGIAPIKAEYVISNYCLAEFWNTHIEKIFDSKRPQAAAC